MSFVVVTLEGVVTLEATDEDGDTVGDGVGEVDADGDDDLDTEEAATCSSSQKTIDVSAKRAISKRASIDGFMAFLDLILFSFYLLWFVPCESSEIPSNM